ncbi:MAG: 4Fe-4S dicluster domain-containing protein [Planctomycetota bacterium]
MSDRLIIDLDLCRECGECTAECAYPYHDPNRGVAALRELAAQELVCRRCELRSCVEACPNDALEEAGDDRLVRHNMRCTGCLSCSVACPFGVLVPAALQFRDSRCDYCAERAEGLPVCGGTCPEKAIRFGPVPERQPDLHVLSENLAVRCAVWQKSEALEET